MFKIVHRANLSRIIDRPKWPLLSSYLTLHLFIIYLTDPHGRFSYDVVNSTQPRTLFRTRVFARRTSVGSRWWLIDFARPVRSRRTLLLHAEALRRDVARNDAPRRASVRR